MFFGLKFPLTTAIGGLMNYIVTADSKHFQPMNVNFSLIPGLGQFLLIKCIRMGHKKRAPFSVAEETFSFQYSIL